MPKLGKAARKAGWISADEAAAIIGVDVETVRGLCEDRLIPSMRFSSSGQWRLRPADVHAWVEEQLRATRPVRRKAPK